MAIFFFFLNAFNDFVDSSENRSLLNPATLERLLYILNQRNNTDTSKSIAFIVNSNTVDSVSNNPCTCEHKVTLSNGEDDATLKLKESIKDLSEENEAIKLELNKMQQIEQQYQEIVKISELCDDDEKHRVMVKSLERCHEFENNLKNYERKINFLQGENDNLYKEIRFLKVSSLELMNDMKIEILDKTQELIKANTFDENETEKEEIKQLEGENQELRLKLNGLCLNVLKNMKSLDEENLLSIDIERLSKVTVLENNLSSSFITRNELNEIKSKLLKMQATIDTQETREKYLQELVKITQQQLKSQQLMLTQFSDDEIAARHLIVDLQSQSNENYLLTKTSRDLKISKENEDRLRLENDTLKSELIVLQNKMEKALIVTEEKLYETTEKEKSNILKIQYLKKTLKDLCSQYSSMTPTYLITDFIQHYVELLEAKKQFNLNMLKMKADSMPEISRESFVRQLKEISMTDIEAKIEIIKYKSSCDYLKQQLELHEATIKELHDEITRSKLNEIKSVQHWNALKMLFNSNQAEPEKMTKDDSVQKAEQCHKGIQVDVTLKNCGTNTDHDIIVDENTAQQTEINVQHSSRSSQSSNESKTPTKHQLSTTNDGQYSLEMQLKKALSLASSRSSLLIETENRLSEAQGRIKILERNLDNQMKQRVNEQHQESISESVTRRDDHILSITVATLQNLILDKDTNLSRYQELLKSERQHNMRTFDELSEQIKQLKKVIDNNETMVEERQRIIEKLRQQVSELEEDKLKLETIASAKPAIPVQNNQHQLHVTFNDDNNERDIEIQSMEIKLKEAHTEVKKMEQKLNDLTNTERQLQNIIREKDTTIKDLNIRLKASNENFETLSENFTSHNELEQLREMLEEKDKHIQDLTDTLNQFHDDQQKYINDTAINSAEQVHIISGNLTRAETTNRILTTQLEALKRQLSNVQQREKQSREMIKTLKDQLIKRPVISVRR